MQATLNQAPKYLWQCQTGDAQAAWIERALRAGRTVSDSGLWLGGVGNPQSLIARMRKSGLQIQTTTKRIVDAAGEVHNDLAWRLEPTLS